MVDSALYSRASYVFDFIYVGGVLMYKPQKMYPTQYYKI